MSSIKMTVGFDDLLGTLSAKNSENNLLRFQICHCQNDIITVLSVVDAL